MSTTPFHFQATTAALPLIPSTPGLGKSSREIPWLGGLVLLSIAIHVALVGGIGRGGNARRQRVRPPTTVTMEVMAPKPPPPAPVAEPEAPRAPVKPVAPRVAARAKAPVAAPRPAAPEPEAETPADFSGVTLTNDGPGPGWASAMGNGGAMNGPIGTPGARVMGGSRAAATGGASAAGKTIGPPTVKLADLSSPPRAPVLNDVLEHNYPEDARKRGLQGKAVLRVRVMPDGHVRELLVLAESGGGFGEACRRTLRNSVWSPPLDRDARPVSTFVSYTCTFEVH